MNSFNEFIEYVYSFYGDGGLYDQKRTREQIAYATLDYLDGSNDVITWGNGDSLDRERVRDTMNKMYGDVSCPILLKSNSTPLSMLGHFT